MDTQANDPESGGFDGGDARAAEGAVLLDRYGSLFGEELTIKANALLVLAEIDRKRIAIRFGYSSLFDMLQRRFRHSESTAARRVVAAKLLNRFPQIAGYLADGRLNECTLRALKDVLEEDTVDATLERAAGMTEAEVRRLVATIRPQPAAPDFVPPASAPEMVGSTVNLTATGVATGVSARPLDGEWTEIRLTVPKEFLAVVDEIRSLLSHRMPGARPSQIMLEALKLGRDVLKKQRVGAPPKQKVVEAGIADEAAPVMASDGRHVPCPLAHAVWERDRGACTFVGPDGVRCGSTHKPELEHIVPYGKGGPTAYENLTIHCSAHNQLRADQEYGEGFMAARRGKRRDVVLPVEADVIAALEKLEYSARDARQAAAAAIEKLGAETPFLELVEEALASLRRRGFGW